MTNKRDTKHEISLHDVIRVRVNHDVIKIRQTQQWQTSVNIYNDRRIWRKFHDIRIEFLRTPQSVLSGKPLLQAISYTFNNTLLPKAKYFPKIPPPTRQGFSCWGNGQDSPSTSQKCAQLQLPSRLPTKFLINPTKGSSLH